MNAPSIQLNVPLNFNQLLSLVKQLSTRDKLKLESLIWEETDESEIEIPATQQKMVSARLQEMNKNPQSCKSWGDIERNLRL
ncbi:addiction module protein [Viscerimonas tarda]